MALVRTPIRESVIHCLRAETAACPDLIARRFPGFLFFAMLILSPGSLPAQALQADTDIATAGFFQLRWTADGPVELQESPSPDFSMARTIYIGADTARIISGKPDGDWFYRLRPAEAASRAQWTEPLQVTVSHHPLGRALAFFFVGAAVFAATLALIIKGSRQYR